MFLYVGFLANPQVTVFIWKKRHFWVLFFFVFFSIFDLRKERVGVLL